MGWFGRIRILIKGLIRIDIYINLGAHKNSVKS